MNIMVADSDIASMAMFAKPSRGLRDQLSDSMNRLRGVVRDSSIVQRAVNRFQSFTSGEMFRKIDAVRHRMVANTEADSVRELKTTAQISNAPPTMRRFMMANKKYRDLYHLGSAVGYGDRYIDNSPGVSGKYHHDYNLVIDGMMMTENVVIGDKEVKQSYIVNYFSSVEEDYELSSRDKITYLKSWANLERLLEQSNIDPCDPEGGLLS